MSAVNPYASFISTQATALGIPQPVAFGLFAQEDSSYNPNLIGDNGAAVGLGQLHAGAASDVGVTDRFDPYQNITGSLTYLQQQYNKFGNWNDALAAYNQGAGATGSAWQQGLAYAQSAYQKGVSYLQQFGEAVAGTDGSSNTTGYLKGGAEVLGGVASLDPSAIASGVGDIFGTATTSVFDAFKNWIESTSFFQRAALIVLGLIFVAAGLYLYKPSVVNNAVKMAATG